MKRYGWIAPEDVTYPSVCFRMSIPDEQMSKAAFWGALTELANARNWDTGGDDEKAEALATDWRERIFAADDCTTESEDTTMLGLIVPVVRNSLPDKMLWCDGAVHFREDYPDLYALLDDAFKLDADTFVVPDLRQRFVFGAVPAGAYPVGQTGGAATHVLTTSEMPTHTHIQNAHNHTQNAHTHVQDAHNHSQNAHTHSYAESIEIPVRQNSGMTGGAGRIAAQTNTTANGIETVTPAPMLPAVAGILSTTATNQNATATNNAATATNQDAGGGQAHNNMPPYAALRYAIFALP